MLFFGSRSDFPPAALVGLWTTESFPLLSLPPLPPRFPHYSVETGGSSGKSFAKVIDMGIAKPTSISLNCFPEKLAVLYLRHCSFLALTSGERYPPWPFLLLFPEVNRKWLFPEKPIGKPYFPLKIWWQSAGLTPFFCSLNLIDTVFISLVLSFCPTYFSAVFLWNPLPTSFLLILWHGPHFFLYCMDCVAWGSFFLPPPQLSSTRCWNDSSDGKAPKKDLSPLSFV